MRSDSPWGPVGGGRKISGVDPSGQYPDQGSCGQNQIGRREDGRTVRNIPCFCGFHLDDLGLIAALEWQGREVSPQ